jgi:hypothetical protein
MPNGKGSIDCSYCVHFDGEGYPDGWTEERRCKFHQTMLPKPSSEHLNRFCCHFEPNQTYCEDNLGMQFFPVVRRFAWFGIDLEPGVLYEFPYPAPHEAKKLAVLRIPDFQNIRWIGAGDQTGDD